MSEKRTEQLRGLQAFVERFLAARLSADDAASVLEVLDTGPYAARDLPRLIAQARLRH